MADPRAFLTETAATMRKMTVRIRVIDSALVERDIAARRLEADIGMLFYKNFDKIEAALKATGSNMGINEWVELSAGSRATRSLAGGSSIKIGRHTKPSAGSVVPARITPARITRCN